MTPDYFVARDQDDDVWMFNMQPELQGGFWFGAGDALYLGTVDKSPVYVEELECLKVTQFDIALEYND